MMENRYGVLRKVTCVWMYGVRRHAGSKKNPATKLDPEPT